MEPSLYCEYEPSSINNQLKVCKHCQMVVRTETEQNIICPVLLDLASKDPNFPQIRLDKISTRDSSGKIISSISSTNYLNQWWGDTSIFGSQKNKTNLTKKEPEGKKCTQEQIDARLAICNGCEFYKNNSCLKCGCSLSREKNYMNKLYWADKSCPIGKWGPVESKE